MTTIEQPTLISTLLRESQIRVDVVLGWLDPVAVIEKRHMVVGRNKPIYDTDLLTDFDELKLFSVAVNMLAVRHGCVGIFFSETTTHNLNGNIIRDAYFDYYGIRVIPGANQTAEDYYGNLHAMHIALATEEAQYSMKSAIDNRLVDVTFKRYMDEMSAGLAQSILKFVSFRDRLANL